MTVIERWTVRVCGECGEAWQHGEGCPFPGDYIMGGEGEAVEVVRAVDYQGAVDLLAEFVGHRADSSLAWLDDWTRRVDAFVSTTGGAVRP